MNNEFTEKNQKLPYEQEQDRSATMNMPENESEIPIPCGLCRLRGLSEQLVIYKKAKPYHPFERAFDYPSGSRHRHHPPLEGFKAEVREERRMAAVMELSSTVIVLTQSLNKLSEYLEKLGATKSDVEDAGERKS